MAHIQIIAKKPFDKLATELVHEILADVLQVPDAMFRRPSVILDAVLDPEFLPCSSVLLVSKRFFDIAEPLLYRTVILRNNAQAQALEDALTGKGQHLTSFVKRLRIDGMWPSLCKILPLCTGIELFYMVLDKRSAVSPIELCNVLGTINPVEFVLCDLPERNSKSFEQVLHTIANAVPNWKRLTTFTLPKNSYEPTTENFELVSALAASPSMRHLYVKTVGQWPATWDALKRNPSILLYMCCRKSNRVLPVRRDFYPEMKSCTVTWPAVTRSSRKGLVPNGPISLKPLLAQPKEVWTKILLCIFSYVTLPPRELKMWASEECTLHDLALSNMRDSLMKSSEIFHHVINQIMFKVPLFIDRGKFFTFVETVRQTPILGQRIEELTLDFGICKLAVGSGISEPDIDHDLWTLLNLLRPIPGTTNGLRYFHSKTIRLSWEALFLLSGVAGSTLVRLRIPFMTRPHTPVHPPDFGSRICEPHGLGIASHALFIPVIDDPWFPCVQHLSFSLGIPETIEVLAQMKWPSLKALVIMGKSRNWTPEVAYFLALNGEHLIELDIDGENDSVVYNFCPNLRVLRLTGNTGILREELFYHFTSHKYLEHIVIHQRLRESTLRDAGDASEGEINVTQLFFEVANFSGFMNLRKLEFPGYSWPREEFEIARALMPGYAEKFKEKFNIEIIARGGKAWRQRLQCRR